MLGFKAYRDDLGDYMKRWVLKLPTGHSIRVHHILRPDADRELHNHPFRFVSLLLSGFYDEERGDPQDPTYRKKRQLLRGGINICTLETRHRITWVPPGGTWTILLTGRRRQPWGFFLQDGTFVLSKEFMSVYPFRGPQAEDDGWQAPDDPSWDPEEVTRHTAHELLQCAICAVGIREGSRYLRWCFGADGEVHVIRVHPDCLRLLEEHGKDERWDSATWDDILDNMSVEELRAAADACADATCAAELRKRAWEVARTNL